MLVLINWITAAVGPWLWAAPLFDVLPFDPPKLLHPRIASATVNEFVITFVSVPSAPHVLPLPVVVASQVSTRFLRQRRLACSRRRTALQTLCHQFVQTDADTQWAGLFAGGEQKGAIF